MRMMSYEWSVKSDLRAGFCHRVWCIVAKVKSEHSISYSMYRAPILHL